MKTKRNTARDRFEAALRDWEARNPTNPFLEEMASFKPDMLVDIYMIDDAGAEALEIGAVALSSCFPDDAGSVDLALHDLKTDGKHVTGGGAAPTLIIRKART